MTSQTTIRTRYVNDYRTGSALRVATQADIERAERDGDQHTGAHRDNDGRTGWPDPEGDAFGLPFPG